MLAQVRVASCVAWYWRNRNAQANLNDRDHSADYVWIMANRRSYLLIILYLNSFILPFCTRRWGFSDRTRMAFLLWLQYVGCFIFEKQRKLSASFLVSYGKKRSVRGHLGWQSRLLWRFICRSQFPVRRHKSLSSIGRSRLQDQLSHCSNLSF